MRPIRQGVLALAAGALLVAAAPAGAAPTRLAGVVGPGFTITLTKGGRKVTALAPGRYVITVRDRSREHDFHLRGPGVDRRTSVAGLGTATWRVTLRKGTYRFVCDPHAAAMKGSVRVG